MSVSVTARIEGVEETVAKLKEIETKAVRRVVNAGVRAGVKPLLAQARTKAPQRTGGLRTSLKAGSVKLDRRSGTVSGTVNAGQSSATMKKKGLTAYYAHMVVGGTKPHMIRPNRKKALTIGERFSAWAMHPGSRPNPFFEDAAEAGQQQAIGDFTKAFNEKFNQEVNK